MNPFMSGSYTHCLWQVHRGRYAQSVEKVFHLHFSVIRMGSHDTFALWRLGSVAFKLSISSSVNCGHVAANRSAGRTAEFVNIGRNVVVALKSGPVETGPTVPVATALQHEVDNWGWSHYRYAGTYTVVSPPNIWPLAVCKYNPTTGNATYY